MLGYLQSKQVAPCKCPCPRQAHCRMGHHMEGLFSERPD